MCFIHKVESDCKNQSIFLKLWTYNFNKCGSQLFKYLSKILYKKEYFKIKKTQKFYNIFFFSWLLSNLFCGINECNNVKSHQFFMWPFSFPSTFLKKTFFFLFSFFLVYCSLTLFITINITSNGVLFLKLPIVILLSSTTANAQYHCLFTKKKSFLRLVSFYWSHYKQYCEFF